MKTKIFLALILTAFTFNSCQKDQFEEQLAEPQKDYVSINNTTPENALIIRIQEETAKVIQQFEDGSYGSNRAGEAFPHNPFDEEAAKHNEVLQFIFDHPDFTPTVTVATLVDIVNEFSLQNDGTIEFPDTDEIIELVDFLFANITTPDGSFDPAGFINVLNMPQIEKTILQDYLNATISTENVSLRIAISKVTEALIIADKSALTQFSRDRLLIIIGTARYSHFFWDNFPGLGPGDDIPLATVDWLAAAQFSSRDATVCGVEEYAALVSAVFAALR